MAKYLLRKLINSFLRNEIVQKCKFRFYITSFLMADVIFIAYQKIIKMNLTLSFFSN